MTDQFVFDLQQPKPAPDKAARQAERLRNLKARYGRTAAPAAGNVVSIEAVRRKAAAKARAQRRSEVRFMLLAEGRQADDRDQA